MALSQNAGAPGPPKKAATGKEVKDRSDKSYGNSKAGFGLKKGGMDSALGPKKQVNQKKKAARLRPNMDAGQKRGV